MSLDIEVFEVASGRLQIGLGGRLDTHTFQRLEDRLDTLDPELYPLQILNLEGLGYLSSAGLRCIFKAKKKLQASRARLLILRVQPPVKKVMDIIKAFPEEEIFADEKALESYLSGIQSEISAGQ